MLIVSKSGDLTALAPRIGGSLMIFRPYARKKHLYDGLAPIFSSMEDAIRSRPEYILFDQIDSYDKHGQPVYGIGALADALRRRYPVWGAGTLQDALENNRAWALSVFLEAGMRIPTTLVFDPERGKDWQAVDLEDRLRVHRVKGHLKEARAFVEHAGGRWVLKPHDNGPTSLSYVPQDTEDLAHRLEMAREKHQVPPQTRFILQRFVPGVEISTEVWVSNGEIIGPPNATLETKRLMAGDLGPSTGCQTSAVFVYPSQDVRIMRKTIGRADFRAWLKKPTMPTGRPAPGPYHGPLDLNCIVSEEDHQPYVLEPTPRFGYNAIYALLELLDADPRSVFRGYAAGEAAPASFRTSQIAYALRVSIPPYPAADAIDDPAALDELMEMATHVDILGPVDSPHVWLLDAQKVGEAVRTAGFDAVVLEVTSSAGKLEDAVRAADDLFEQLRIPDKQARTTDGADRAKRDLARLASWGYESFGVPTSKGMVVA